MPSPPRNRPPRRRKPDGKNRPPRSPRKRVAPARKARRGALGEAMGVSGETGAPVRPSARGRPGLRARSPRGVPRARAGRPIHASRLCRAGKFPGMEHLRRERLRKTFALWRRSPPAFRGLATHASCGSRGGSGGGAKSFSPWGCLQAAPAFARGAARTFGRGCRSSRLNAARRGVLRGTARGKRRRSKVVFALGDACKPRPRLRMEPRGLSGGVAVQAASTPRAGAFCVELRGGSGGGAKSFSPWGMPASRARVCAWSRADFRAGCRPGRLNAARRGVLRGTARGKRRRSKVVFALGDACKPRPRLRMEPRGLSGGIAAQAASTPCAGAFCVELRGRRARLKGKGAKGA